MTDQASDLLPPELIAANQAAQEHGAANFANSVTGIYGISGVGKSSLADTAAEYCAETFPDNYVTLCYIADLGGFGNKRLTLIRGGIMRVWDPRNHINPFETMELMSLGAWPLELIDPERGLAAPDVPLILPRRIAFDQYCPAGHVVKRFESAALLAASTTACPTCGVMTNAVNALKVEKVVVRHRMFKHVGHRIYDSMSALNDWGMQDLQKQSAAGTLPRTASGGSLLGAADALVSGSIRFGGSSEGQYGFLQNRTYGWLSNIRSIPDHVIPPTATFFVEISKEKKGGGGDVHYGPKIAGSAATGSIGGWLGNCVHATREPFDLNDPASPLVYRAWLRNHIDPRDTARLPYVCKIRGTPLGMPDYLEDRPGEKPWSGCSMAVLYQKLQEQLTVMDAETETRYAHIAGRQMWRGDVGGGEADEVIAAVAAGGVPSAGGGAVQAGAPVATGSAVPIAARAGRRRVAGSAAIAVAPVPVSQVSTALPSATDSGVSAAAVSPAAPSIEMAGVVAREGSNGTPAQETQEPLAAVNVQQPTVPVSPPLVAAPTAQVTQPSPAPAAAPTVPAVRRPVRRVARPPVGS